MILDRARTDSKLAPGFLVGSAGRELLQYLAFAARQRFASGKMHRCDIRRGILRLPTSIGPDRLIEPVNDFAAPERFFDEVERTVLDRADRHGDIALPGDHEDRRRIILAVKFLQDVEAGFTRNMYIKQDASRASGSRNRQ